MDIYNASCNPPRRAKRHRSDDDDDIPDSLSSLSQDDDDNDDDQPQQPPPKRRGRKPGTLSRAAREAQRKINHSLIEKARRTKINDALATLRELVPPEYKQEEEEEEPDPKKPKSKPKASGEKEFKLEILVRTVAYLQDLTAKVRQLEHDGCPRCSEPITLPSAPAPKPQHNESPSRDSSVSRLPSISTWLPEEQRSLLLTPSQSPPFDVTARPTQLPTPPSSATCAPATTGFLIPPALTLPSPSTFLPPMQPRFSGFTARANHKSSPAASPIYTPDDETAASLLLRISTAPKATRTEVQADKNGLSALTPSRLLGLSPDR
ncbi:hypothetical protein JVU11DRAFT_9881 [Chiua virens]|nr:hypothetical protein JVU11DRAFT_9881 [Chiua virens]